MIANRTLAPWPVYSPVAEEALGGASVSDAPTPYLFRIHAIDCEVLSRAASIVNKISFVCGWIRSPT
jgi:hypothetical protein